MPLCAWPCQTDDKSSARLPGLPASRMVGLQLAACRCDAITAQALSSVWPPRHAPLGQARRGNAASITRPSHYMPCALARLLVEMHIRPPGPPEVIDPGARRVLDPHVGGRRDDLRQFATRSSAQVRQTAQFAVLSRPASAVCSSGVGNPPAGVRAGLPGRQALASPAAAAAAAAPATVRFVTPGRPVVKMTVRAECLD